MKILTAAALVTALALASYVLGYKLGSDTLHERLLTCSNLLRQQQQE